MLKPVKTTRKYGCCKGKARGAGTKDVPTGLRGVAIGGKDEADRKEGERAW